MSELKMPQSDQAETSDADESLDRRIATLRSSLERESHNGDAGEPEWGQTTASGSNGQTASVTASLAVGPFGGTLAGGVKLLAAALILSTAIAERGARLAMRGASATAARSFALAASATVTSRRRRGDLAWYLAATLLAAGIGLLVTVWLNPA
jgi:hypothetical protein